MKVLLVGCRLCKSGRAERKIRGGDQLERIFAFIRYAMDPESQPAPEMKGEDWLRLFDFAEEQAILGVVFRGIIERVKSHTDLTDPTDLESGGPDYDLIMEWGYVAQQVEEQNMAINRKCVEVQKELEEAGFQCCILKGQGNAMILQDIKRIWRYRKG